MSKKRKDFQDWAKAETQAIKAMKVIMDAGLVKSVGTNRNYLACLTAFTQFIKDNKLGDLRHSTTEIADRYLQARSADLAQKTLDMHRLAIQVYFRANGELKEDDRLTIVKSQAETVLEHRAYTAQQVQKIANAQTERTSLSTRIAYAAGLRAHELLTLRPLAEQPADIRRYEDGTLKSLDTKWKGREEGVPYSVIGKGGLIREVRIPQDLAVQLESHRLPVPERVRDRNVFYMKHYDIQGGQPWSNSFSAASKRALGWSTGAHGLRHAYAQERMDELRRFCSRDQALETVSQEMGHFRPDITLTYLR